MLAPRAAASGSRPDCRVATTNSRPIRAPGLRPWADAVILAGSALWGLTYAVSAAVRIRGNQASPEAPHWTDFWFYGVAPAVAYLGLAIAAFAVLEQAPRAAHIVAVSLMVLLLVGIRNAWDLVTWLAPRAPPHA